MQPHFTIKAKKAFVIFKNMKDAQAFYREYKLSPFKKYYKKHIQYEGKLIRDTLLPIVKKAPDPAYIYWKEAPIAWW